MKKLLFSLVLFLSFFFVSVFAETVILSPGWNVVSTPVFLDSIEFSNDGEGLVFYTLGEDGWESVIPNVDTVTPLEGFLVNNSNSSNVYMGMNSDSDIQPMDSLFSKDLHEGWNIVGIADDENPFISLDDDVSILVDFVDNENDNKVSWDYDYGIYNGIETISNLEDLDYTRAYAVFSSDDGVFGGVMDYSYGDEGECTVEEVLACATGSVDMDECIKRCSVSTTLSNSDYYDDDLMFSVLYPDMDEVEIGRFDINIENGFAIMDKLVFENFPSCYSLDELFSTIYLNSLSMYHGYPSHWFAGVITGNSVVFDDMNGLIFDADNSPKTQTFYITGIPKNIDSYDDVCQSSGEFNIEPHFVDPISGLDVLVDNIDYSSYTFNYSNGLPVVEEIPTGDNDLLLSITATGGDVIITGFSILGNEFTGMLEIYLSDSEDVIDTGEYVSGFFYSNFGLISGVLIPEGESKDFIVSLSGLYTPDAFFQINHVHYLANYNNGRFEDHVGVHHLQYVDGTFGEFPIIKHLYSSIECTVEEVLFCATLGNDMEECLAACSASVTLEKTNSSVDALVRNRDGLYLGYFEIVNEESFELQLEEFDIEIDVIGTGAVGDVIDDVKVVVDGTTKTLSVSDETTSTARYSYDEDKKFTDSLKVYMYVDTQDIDMDGISIVPYIKNIDITETLNGTDVDDIYPKSLTFQRFEGGNSELAVTTNSDVNDDIKTIIAGNEGIIAELDLESDYSDIDLGDVTVIFSEYIEDSVLDVELIYEGVVVATNPEWTRADIAVFEDVDVEVTEDGGVLEINLITESIDEDHNDYTVANVIIDSIVFTDMEDNGDEIADVTFDISSIEAFSIVPADVVASITYVDEIESDVSFTVIVGSNETEDGDDVEVTIESIDLSYYGAELTTLLVEDEDGNDLYSGAFANTITLSGNTLYDGTEAWTFIAGTRDTDVYHKVEIKSLTYTTNVDSSKTFTYDLDSNLTIIKND